MKPRAKDNGIPSHEGRELYMLGWRILYTYMYECIFHIEYSRNDIYLYLYISTYKNWQSFKIRIHQKGERKKEDVLLSTQYFERDLIGYKNKKTLHWPLKTREEKAPLYSIGWKEIKNTLNRPMKKGGWRNSIFFFILLEKHHQYHSYRGTSGWETIFPDPVKTRGQYLYIYI
jgi:hypothetical protein